MSLGAFALVASEFMPVSLLTPIAADFGITEGQAGQAISVSGAFAVLTSLLIAKIVGRTDRKRVLLALTGLVIVSGTIVAIAPTYEIFLIGRALIGVAIGGFWSMSAATAMRLVPDRQVPRALAILNGGNALATVIAAPLGSVLGSLVGWRGAFFLVVPTAVVVFLWQMISLPRLTLAARPGSSNLRKLLGRNGVALGMVAVSLFFMGQFALFTYLRPFLESVVHLDVTAVSAMQLVMGIAGLAGTVLVGRFLQRDGLYRTLVVIPVLMALIASALMLLGGGIVSTAVLLGMWGLFGTAAPVGWWSWIAATMPEDAEAGGGLMVAVVQLAIASGAVAGGLMFDLSGYRMTFGASAVILLTGAALVVVTSRSVRGGAA